MGILQLVNTINSLAEAVPEIADLCRTLVNVAKDYEADKQQEDARDRWHEKNAAIDSAIADVWRMRESQAEQHGEAAQARPVRICGNCGAEVR